MSLLVTVSLLADSCLHETAWRAVPGGLATGRDCPLASASEWNLSKDTVTVTGQPWTAKDRAPAPGRGNTVTVTLDAEGPDVELVLRLRQPGTWSNVLFWSSSVPDPAPGLVANATASYARLFCIKNGCL